jgi:hypothetical protein
MLYFSCAAAFQQSPCDPICVQLLATCAALGVVKAKEGMCDLPTHLHLVSAAELEQGRRCLHIPQVPHNQLHAAKHFDTDSSSLFTTARNLGSARRHYASFTVQP